MKYLEKYTSVGCNQTPESLDWGDHNLVLFAASHAVVFYDPTKGQVIRTIAKHSARVNTVKWIHDNTKSSKAVQFISGSDDNTSIVYTVDDVFRSDAEVHIQTLTGHSGGIKALDAIYVNGSLIVVTVSADLSLKVWNCTADAECTQTVELNKDICFAVRLFSVNADVYLAAASGDQVVVYKKSENGLFEVFQSLVGHEDWVRGLDVVNNGNELLLSSSSQDTFIRIWKATLSPEINESIVFSLESVLSGHDGWVYSVQWNKSREGSLQLLSSSMDKSMILWELKDAIWMEKLRVGDIGGHFLGFFGAKMSPSKSSILGHGYHGSFHLWNKSETNENSWEPGFMVGGHFGEVRDIGWDPKGEYLLSVSADQTSRIHGPYRRNAWFEVARPQVHGYDMQVVAVLDRYRFASGAEEKIVRTFQAPSDFVRSLRNICEMTPDSAGDFIINSNSKSATLPTLGLSNQVESGSIDEEESSDQHPPTEETLMQNTLWPETQKLYGHGYEVFALAATPDGKLLASSCKATNAEHAQIILWNTNTWKQHQKLAVHQLTVTQMQFSPDNKFLLSVSRDRKWALFARNTESTSSEDDFQLVASTNKQNGIHGRIIWTCDWSHDSKFFATGSRDGKCVVWHSNNDNNVPESVGNYTPVDILELNESITAVAFGKQYYEQESYIIAVGCESGLIKVYSFNNTWENLLTLDQTNAHHLSVRKLSFRPPISTDNEHRHCLASCGNDNFLRIFEFV